MWFVDPRNTARIVCLMLMLLSAVASADQYGAEMPAGAAINLAGAIQNLQSSGHKELAGIKVSGVVTEVCQKKGCWMILTDASHYARVKFKDYNFFVPKDSAQHRATIYGTLVEKQLSKKTQQHYKADAQHKGSVKESGVGDSPVGDSRVADREFTLIAESVVLEPAS